MTDTSIEWTHRPGTHGKTWNVTRGCSMVSEGCRHCYAMRQARRFAGPGGWAEGLVNAHTGKWTGATAFAGHKLDEPLAWREPCTVFVNSMSDLYHDGFTYEQIAAVFGVMAACPAHTFIVLTKRPDRMRAWFDWVRIHGQEVAAIEATQWIAGSGGSAAHRRALEERLYTHASTPWPLPNVWLGVSIEDQDSADTRIPPLLASPAVVRFLSAEPLLGQIDLTDRLGVWTSCPDCGRDVTIDEDGCCATCGADAYRWGVDWVIAGCESGPGARACEGAWLRTLRDQCRQARVAFFLKQATAGAGVDSDAPRDGMATIRRRGVLSLPYLDGVQHVAWPQAGDG